MKKLFYMGLMSFNLVACSTVPTEKPIHIGPAIVVTRDIGFTGSGCDTGVKIDKKLVAILSSGKSMIYPVLAGEYKLSAVTGNEIGAAICSNIIMTRTVIVKDNPVYYRVGMTGDYQLLFEEME